MSIKIFTPLLVIFTIISPSAWSAAPSSFNYAGQVFVKGAPYEGNGFFKFALVNFDCTEAPTANASNCQTVWSNDGSSTLGGSPSSAIELIVSNGKFSVNIGDTSVVGRAALDPALLQQQLYLRTWFDDGKNGSEQLKPDNVLNATPYAVSSKVAENAVGFKQTWQDMLGSRSTSTVYQNLTGRPITINVGINDTGSIVFAELRVGITETPDVLVDKSVIGVGGAVAVSAVIPQNYYYSVRASIGAKAFLEHWSELR